MHLLTGHFLTYINETIFTAKIMLGIRVKKIDCLNTMELINGTNYSFFQLFSKLFCQYLIYNYLNCQIVNIFNFSRLYSYWLILSITFFLFICVPNCVARSLNIANKSFFFFYIQLMAFYRHIKNVYQCLCLWGLMCCDLLTTLVQK